MKVISARDPCWQDQNRKSIKLRARLDGLPEEIDFVAMPGDVEEHGIELYSRAMAGEFGNIGEPVGNNATPITLEQAKTRAVEQINALAETARNTVPPSFLASREVLDEGWMGRIEGIERSRGRALRAIALALNVEDIYNVVNGWSFG